MRKIEIESLREKIEGGNYKKILTVYSRGDSKEYGCSPIDLGTDPLLKLLEDPVSCDLLSLGEESSIWKELLGNEKRPVYRILQQDGSFLELTIYENV